MARLTQAVVVAEALDLLDEVGLDRVSTRELARRLNVEQPTLYWHFRNKEVLLHAMAETAMAPHADEPLPEPGEEWRRWFADNTRSFRRTLLAHRDGARLHAGSRPEGDSLERALAKFDFLVAAGLPRHAAQTAMLTASWFTVGSVLEQQQAATAPPPTDADPAAGLHHDVAFEAGLELIIDGLALQQS